MATTINEAQWRLYRDTIEQCLREGFAPYGKRGVGGKGSSVEEAQRRLRASGDVSDRFLLGPWVLVQMRRAGEGKFNCLPNWTLFRQQPDFPEAIVVKPEPAPPSTVAAVKDALMKRPRSLEELMKVSGSTAGGVLDALDVLTADGVNVRRQGDYIEIPKAVQPAWTKDEGRVIELVSRKDNTFCFGAFGDLHAGSKYCRWDVREDLVRRSEQAGAQAIFDTGNFLEGESRFNKFDLAIHGLDGQVRHLAEQHPRTSVPIYAVHGDDHEGWYGQREGIDIGAYVEARMRAAGHDWTDLGFMEAHVRLVNANTGAVANMAVVHPGGGSAYALSYSIQKIVESYEGGEKPAVGLYGHYHKLWSGIIRNVWVVQTGTQQDQTPFMRKKRLEAHVGGAIVHLEQDPVTGAILAMQPQLIRYFNKGWYEGSGRWSHHGPVALVPRGV
jgi:hypothetical protein